MANLSIGRFDDVYAAVLQNVGATGIAPTGETQATFTDSASAVAWAEAFVSGKDRRLVELLAGETLPATAGCTPDLGCPSELLPMYWSVPGMTVV